MWERSFVSMSILLGTSVDEAVEHSPVVERGAPCVCLISTDAPLVMRDLAGRLLQPFAGV